MLGNWETPLAKTPGHSGTRFRFLFQKRRAPEKRTSPDGQIDFITSMGNTVGNTISQIHNSIFIIHTDTVTVYTDDTDNDPLGPNCLSLKQTLHDPPAPVERPGRTCAPTRSDPGL